MKASVKLREDEQKGPLLRAKVPISVLGFPLVSGSAAGEPGELALHLRTALLGGPSLKLTYRPTPIPPSHPFSLTLKSGVGPWGSPDRSPLLISAHLSLPYLFGATAPSNSPSFTIQLKPQIGDFTLKKTAASSAPSNPYPNPSKENGGGIHHSLPLPRSNRTGLEDLLASGASASATTMLPVTRGAALKFRWGVNVSETAVSGWRRLPYLTVEKISIESVEEGEAKRPAKAKEGSDGNLEAMSGMCFWMRKEVEELQQENGLIKDSIEQVRGMVSDRRGSIGGGRIMEKAERKHMGTPLDAATRTRAGSSTTTANTRSSS